VIVRKPEVFSNDNDWTRDAEIYRSRSHNKRENHLANKLFLGFLRAQRCTGFKIQETNYNTTQQLLSKPTTVRSKFSCLNDVMISRVFTVMEGINYVYLCTRTHLLIVNSSQAHGSHTSTVVTVGKGRSIGVDQV